MASLHRIITAACAVLAFWVLCYFVSQNAPDKLGLFCFVTATLAFARLAWEMTKDHPNDQ
jgi:uncharacterized membrane protein YccC